MGAGMELPGALGDGYAQTWLLWGTCGCPWRVVTGGTCFPDWASVIRVGALDCAEEQNHEVCRLYDVHFYPTFRVSRPDTLPATPGAGAGPSPTWAQPQEQPFAAPLMAGTGSWPAGARLGAVAVSAGGVDIHMV